MAGLHDHLCASTEDTTRLADRSNAGTPRSCITTRGRPSHHRSARFAQALRVSNHVQHLHIFGRRGLCILDTGDHLSLPRHVLAVQPRFIIVDIGTNDLAKIGLSTHTIQPTYIASQLIQKTLNVMCDYNVQHVVLCSALHRTTKLNSQTPESFQLLVHDFNKTLHSLSAIQPNITFWSHKGFWQKPVYEWSRDGIHPNTYNGRNKYKTSIRGAIFKALQHIQ